MDRKPLVWLGSTWEDLRDFPEEVREAVGFALHLAQIGQRHRKAHQMQGHLRYVHEVKENFRSDTYRAMYTVRFTDIVYGLHAFRKKATKGKSTPKKELDLIKRRLEEAKKHHESFEKERHQGKR